LINVFIEFKVRFIVGQVKFLEISEFTELIDLLGIANTVIG